LRFDPLHPSLTSSSPDPVSANGQYRIPTSNPFQGPGQVPEIYAYGLRNPYRFAFDRANGELIHADVGTEYTNSKAVSIGYMLFDHTGRLVDSQSVDARIPPVMNGVPSPLQYRIGASVVPGEYTLKLAVAEGDKVGSIEHPIHAVLADAGLIIDLPGGSARLRERPKSVRQVQRRNC